MNDIYEINYELFSTLYDEWENKNNKSYLSNSFLVKNKNGTGYFGVDNNYGEWFEEDFKNKGTAICWLKNDDFDVEDAVNEYNKHKKKYNNVKDIKSQEEFCNKYNLYHRDYVEFDPSKEYDFKIIIGNDVKEFSSTIKTAIGFASNYESDLLYNGALLLSPLGMTWEENFRLINRYLGKDYLKDNPKLKDWGVPYVDVSSHLLHFKDEYNMRI